MAIYDKYAEVYDASGQIRFSLRMIPYLDQLLERHGLHVESALDLACGTGTLAIALAAKGWTVYGVDASAAMLEQARAKMREVGVSVEFIQQDMRSFKLPAQVDLVTCFYDSMNYLLDLDDVQEALGCVASGLKPVGAFIFDMNTIYHLESRWDNDSGFLQDAAWALGYKCGYDSAKKRAMLTFTGFIKRGELYERFEEAHTEQGYEPRQIDVALENSGLEVVGKYDCFTVNAPPEDSRRIAWVARKGRV